MADSLLKQIRIASGLDNLIKGIPVVRQGMIPVSQPGNMVPVAGMSAPSMIPVASPNAINVRGGPMGARRGSGMVTVNNPGPISVNAPNMIGVNSAPAIPVASGQQMIAVTPPTGDVPVVDTMMYPNNNNVPRSWSQVFMGPGQPFAGLTMTGTRAEDGENEPRTMQYVPNINSTIAPRIAWGLTPFSELRNYAENVPEAAMCMRLLTEEMKAFIPSIIDEDTKSEVKPPELSWMVEYPDRVNPFPVWLSRFLYNVIVYDAPAVYKMRADNPNKNILGKRKKGKLLRKTELQPDGSMTWYCPKCGHGNDFRLGKVNLSDEPELPTFCERCDTDAPPNALQKMGLLDGEYNDLEKDFANNQIIGLRVIDGSTIFALIDERGEQPDPPAPAFTQVIWGVPRMYLNKHQLWYRPRHLRADAPYGRSFIEDSLPAVKTLASLWDYEFEKYQVGNIPELALTAPPDWASTEEILQFESAYNDRMSGNNRERVRARFFPNGTTVLQTKEMTFNNDTYQAATNTVRMAAGIPKSEAGEAPEGMMGGKGFAEAMQSAFYRMGLSPLQTFVEGLFNEVLKENGYVHYRFQLKFPQDSLDPEKEESKWQGRFVQGIAKRDEARTGLGMPAVGGKDGELLISPGAKPGEDGEGGDDGSGGAGGPGGAPGGGSPFPGQSGPGDGGKPAGGFPGAKKPGSGVNVRMPGKFGVKQPPKIGVKKMDFDASEFALGYKEEQEHAETVHNDQDIIRQIVLDHLAEDPHYYSHLAASDVGKEAPAEKLEEAGDLKKPGSEQQTGGMVALMMPDDIARKLADSGITWPSGSEPQPASEMHLTLISMGEAADLADPEKLKQLVAQYAANCPPIEGRINGIGRFQECHKEGMSAVYCSFDCPELPEIRQGLVRLLKENGMPFEENHGFTPHITLAYVPQTGEASNVTNFPVMDVNVPALTVALGGEFTSYPLSGDNMNVVKVIISFGSEARLMKQNGVSADDDQYFGAPVKHVVDVEMPHQGANDSFIVAIGGGDLEAAPAVWKPASGEKESLKNWIGGDLYRRSECAYLLDREIAPDSDSNLVPVTFIDNVDGKVGSVQYFVRGAKPRKDVEEYDPKWVEQAAVLDYVMGQVDRVSKNWLTHPDDPRRPVLIDNDLSFATKKDEEIRSDFWAAMSEHVIGQELLDSLFLLIGNRDVWSDIAENLDNEEAALYAQERARLIYKEGKLPKHPTLLVKEGEGGGMAAPAPGGEGMHAADVPGVYLVGASGSSGESEVAETTNPKAPRMIKVSWKTGLGIPGYVKAEFDETKHPRGNKDNPGQFAPKGEGGAKPQGDRSRVKMKRYEPKQEAQAAEPAASTTEKKYSTAPKLDDTGYISPPADGFELVGNSYSGDFQAEHGSDYLYHTATANALDSIKEKGLISGQATNYQGYKTPDVALATNVDEANYFAQLRANSDFDNRGGMVRTPVIFRVKASNTTAQPYKWHVNEVRSGNISPENIEVWDGKDWNPLQDKPVSTPADEPVAEQPKPHTRDAETVKLELGPLWNTIKTKGGAQEMHDKLHALRKEVIQATRADYEKTHEPIKEFGDEPKGKDANEVYKLPWEVDQWEQGDPDWARKARDGYVVNDPRTLKNNMSLRSGGDVSDSWLNRTDRLCDTGHFTDDALLYRGAAMRMDQIDAMLKSGGFTDPAFMSTSPFKDTAEGYGEARVNDDPLKGNQVVMFTLHTAANGPTFGRMDRTEYVMRRGCSIKITGVRRPSDKEQWEVYGELM